MDPARKDALFRAFETLPGIRVTGTHVYYERSGALSKVEKMKPVLEVLVPLAKAMSVDY
jgi:hypothetical protein